MNQSTEQQPTGAVGSPVERWVVGLNEGDEMNEWKLVPVVPTSEMVASGGDELCQHTTEFLASMQEQAETVYRAMLAAAPEPPYTTLTVEAALKAQDWKGMDGAIAWHLIERHAEGWADVGRMMNAWLAANKT